MVKTSDAAWLQKILQFKAQKNASVSENSAFLLDILQGLYEEIQESTKFELLNVLQEYTELLIQGPDVAEQAAGTIIGLLENLQDVVTVGKHHNKHYIASCLITATTIVIEFELREFNCHLVQDLIRILMRTARKVNQPALAFIRKTACECLVELEINQPGTMERYLNELYLLSAKEKTYAAQTYLVLFSTVLLNFLQSDVKDKFLIIDSTSDMSVMKIVEKKGKEMASFVAEDYNLLSPTAKWHVGQKIPLIFHQLGIPVSILTTKLVFECGQSMDLYTLHQGISLALSNQENLRSFHDIKMIAFSLLRCISMPHLPQGFRCICLTWFVELLQPLRSLALDIADFAQDAIKQLTPNIFNKINVLTKKFEVITDIASMFKDVNFDLLNLLAVALKSADYGVRGTMLVTLYRLFFLNFIKSKHVSIRQSIVDQIMKITVKNPNIMEHTVDFISSIRNTIHEPVCKNLIYQINHVLLTLDFQDFLKHSGCYLIFLEYVCCEKELWPRAIVDWLNNLCSNTDVCKQGDWLLGSNILLVCRSILRTHTSVMLLQGLADLLWLLHRKYQHGDIRDRALFYYLTIGHASPQHFSKLFASMEAEHKMQVISRRNEIEMPSDLMQGVLPTLRFDAEVFELTKTAKYKANRMAYTSAHNSVYKDIKSYKEMLASESFDKNVYLQLSISLTDHNRGEDIPSKIFALTLKFNSSGPYHDIPELHVAHLSKPGPSDGCSRSSKGEAITVLKFEPRQPMPGSILITSVFSNNVGRTCVAPLKPIAVKFADFFNPLACDTSEQSGDNSSSKLAFEMLWADFGANQRSKTTTDKPCAESVKRLVVNSDTMNSVLRTELSPFLVEQADCIKKYGIFLPPCYCILFVFAISDEETLVRFRLDNWELLSITEEYLESLCDV
eukprot:gene10927-12088_t